MNELITVSGVRGYIDENETAQLNLEDCARGLGFTTVATSGNECVRWQTVRKYLGDLGVATSCNDNLPEFIPENIFYRLAMKAKNETAEKFQTKVADEILPAIRKTGQYSTKPSCIEDVLITQLQAMKDLRQKVDKHDEQLTTVNHRIDSLDACNIAGDLQQRFTAMVKKFAMQNGITFPKAWGEFVTAYNTAYRTNLTALVDNYKEKHGFKTLTKPQYLSVTGKLEDAIRVADKMLNKAS